MPLAPFQTARLKLKRASEHLATLERELDAYTARGPIRIMTAVCKDDPTRFDFSFEATESVPLELSTVIGDFIHNLRTSLDLTACDVVALNKRSTKEVYFPFAKNADELSARIKSKNFNRAHPDAVNLLVEFAPYKGGNLALRGVHDLDVMDKHQALLPSAGSVGAPGMMLMYESTEHIDGLIARGRASLEHAGHLPIGTMFPASFKLVFPKDGPFGELDMVPTLYRLLHYFSRVIDAFEALALGQKPDVNAIKF